MSSRGPIAEIHRAWMLANRHGGRGWPARARQRAGVDLPFTGYSLLLNLHDSGPMRISDVAASVCLDISTVSITLKQLERDGYVARETGTDRRTFVVSLTDLGEDAVQRIQDATCAGLAEVLADWSEKDQRELARLLARLAESHRTHADRVDGASASKAESRPARSNGHKPPSHSTNSRKTSTRA